MEAVRPAAPADRGGHHQDLDGRVGGDHLAQGRAGVVGVLDDELRRLACLGDHEVGELLQHLLGLC